MRRLLLLLLLLLLPLLARAASSPDGGEHPFVGLAYRYVPALEGYVTCTGPLVRLGTVQVFLTTHDCIAYRDGTGERFQVTFSQEPRLTQDLRGFVKDITEDGIAGIGWTERGTQVGFIVLSSTTPRSVRTVPSLPAQVGAFRETFGSQGVDGQDVDWSTLQVISYASKQSDDQKIISRDRRYCGVESAQTLRDLVQVQLQDGCLVGDSGAVLFDARNGGPVVYGVALQPEILPQVRSKAAFVRTDSQAFQEMLQRAAAILAAPPRR